MDIERREADVKAARAHNGTTRNNDGIPCNLQARSGWEMSILALGSGFLMTDEELIDLYRTALVDKICGEMYENRQSYNQGSIKSREAICLSRKFSPEEAQLMVTECNEKYGRTRYEKDDKYPYHYEFYCRYEGHLFIISEYMSGEKSEKTGLKSNGMQLINESII